MSGMDNYPDDILSFNNDPRSPFYVEPPVRCLKCSEQFETEAGSLICDDCLENAE